MDRKKFAPVIFGLLFLMATLNPTRLEASEQEYRERRIQERARLSNTAGCFCGAGALLMIPAALLFVLDYVVIDRIQMTHCPSGMDYAAVTQCKVNPDYAELDLAPTKSLDGCNDPCPQGYSYDFASSHWVDDSTLSYPNGYVTIPQPPTCGRDPGTWEAYHQLATCMTTHSSNVSKLQALNFSRPEELPDGCSVSGIRSLVASPCLKKRYSDTAIFWGKVVPWIPVGLSFAVGCVYGKLAGDINIEH